MTFDAKRTKPSSERASTTAARAKSSSSHSSGLPPAFAGLQQGLGNRGMQRLIAQTVQLKRDSSQPVQRMAESAELEEEELQMKRDPSQPMQRAALPEEEELQMKRDPLQPIQRMAESAELEEEELQMKRDPSQPMQRMALPEEEELQLKRDPSRPVQRKASGMPEQVQRKMENAFNADFSDVNVRVGPEALEVGALAYAQGNDIHFAPGQYNPDSPRGQELLGHELAHVVQQREGRVKPTADLNGVALNDNPALEAEADALGARAARGR